MPFGIFCFQYMHADGRMCMGLKGTENRNHIMNYFCMLAKTMVMVYNRI